MKINWKVRLRNGVFLASCMALLVSFCYDALTLLGIVPAVEEQALLALCDTVLKILAMAGIITDPTTKGLSDSQRAMTYDKPV